MIVLKVIGFVVVWVVGAALVVKMLDFFFPPSPRR
jgi:hypothetical protein